MKHISSAVVAGLLVFGSAAVAAAQTAQVPQAAHAQHAGKGRHAGPGRRDGALLRGIQLSDAEKANIKNIDAKYASQFKALREQNKGLNKGQGKIAKGDTAAMRQRWEANAPQREAMKKIMLAQRADVRAALSPANQAKFDANVKLMEERFAKRAEKGKAGRRAGSL